MEVPRAWNPIRLEGTFEKGLALLADMDRQRLVIRWDSGGRGRWGSGKFEADAWARAALASEVGTSGAAEAKSVALSMGCTRASSALLYVDLDPPGRDVLVAHSGASGRVIQIIHHSHKRSGRAGMFASMVGCLTDCDPAAPLTWSIFDFACTSPAGYRLRSQRLNAGDLSLTFASARARGQWLTIRRMAIARLALARMGLARWLADQAAGVETHYGSAGEVTPLELGATERVLRGLCQTSIRRTRFGWMRWLPRSVTTLVLHDAAADQLILVQGTDSDHVLSLARSAGAVTCSLSQHASRQAQDHQVADALG